MASQKIGVSYARYSREEGDDTFSIDSQNRRNLEYAHKYGIAVSEENVIHDYFTGTTLDRDGVELHIVEWGRAVRNTKEDIMLFGVQSMFAQIDHMSIREQTMRGRREKVEQGIWMGQGSTVYGYTKTGTRRNTQLHINEDEAVVVRLIFKLFVYDRLACAEIARILNAKGTLSPSQIRMRKNRQTPWDKDSVRNILRDTRYIGIFYPFKWEYINNKRLRRDEQEVIKQYFPDLALVDEDTFYAAQDIINERRNKWTFFAQHEYLLNKRMKCLCGYSIVSRTNERIYHRYQCGGKYYKRISKDACILPIFTVAWVDALVWTKLEAFLHNPEYELETLRSVQSKQREIHGDAIMTLENIQNIRAEYTQHKKDAWIDFKVNKSLKQADYDEIVAELDTRLSAAEKLYKEYQEKVSAKVLSDKDIKRIAKEMRTLGELLDEVGSLEFSHKKKVIELLDITGRFEVSGNEILL